MTIIWLWRGWLEYDPIYWRPAWEVVVSDPGTSNYPVSGPKRPEKTRHAHGKRG